MSRRTLGGLLLGAVLAAAAASGWAWWRAWSAPIVSVLVRPDFSVQGVTSGTPVRVRGVVVGQVASIALREDATGRLRPELLLALDPDSLEDQGFAGRLRGDRLQEEVRRGLVARLVSVSPASGMLQVELLWEPGAVVTEGLGPGEVPATGGTLQQSYERLAIGFGEAARLDLMAIARELEEDLDRWIPASDPEFAAKLNADLVGRSEALAASARRVAEGPAVAEISRACLGLREAVESADDALSPRRIAVLQARLADASAALSSMAAALESSRGVMEGASAELSTAFRGVSEAARAWKSKARGLTTEPTPPER
ncbi:MAG: MlaD family protein [Opitutales bacterium]